MELILSEEEREFLELILAERQLALVREIARTDRREFRSTLRGRQERIESLLDRLRTARLEQAS